MRSILLDLIRCNSTFCHSHHPATDRASDGSSTPTPNTANTPTTAAFTKPPTATHTRLSRYSLWSEPRDVWCVKIDPLWIDFLGARSVGQSKTVPFVDAVPITLWLHGRSSSDQNDNPLATALNATPPPPATSKEPFVLSVANLQRSLESDPEYRQNLPSYTANNPFALPLDDEEPTSDERKMPADDDPAMADLHVIAHISNLVSVQIDHFQFLFLLRLAEEITELTTFLSLDSNRIMQNVSMWMDFLNEIILFSVKILDRQGKVHRSWLRHPTARGHHGNALANARQRIFRLR